MTRRARTTPPPLNPGVPAGWVPKDESDHYLECPICGHMIDMRDLAEVIEHDDAPHERPTRN
jgi:hypothetical protein